MNDKTVQFYGASINVLDQNGEAFVAMKPIIGGIGLSWQSQYNKLISEKEKFNCTDINTVADDGKRRSMICIPLKKLNGWLFSINSNKVRSDLKKKVELYQEECSDVLYRYWFKDVKVKEKQENGYDIDLAIAKLAMEVLRLSDAGKIKMMSTICTNHNRPTNLLPSYTEEKITKSLTALLKENKSELSARSVNILLLNLGILEQRTRPSTSGRMKKFKSISEKGMKFGKNLINPNNERETHPHYFVDQFPELLSLINSD